MARTVSLGKALREMQPELEARLNRSAFASFQGKLRVADSRESVLLTLDHSEIGIESVVEGGPGASEGGTEATPGDPAADSADPAIASRDLQLECDHEIVGGDSLVQLLIGSAPPAEVARHSGIRFRGEGEHLAEALFPPIYPNLPPWDMF